MLLNDLVVALEVYNAMNDLECDDPNEFENHNTGECNVHGHAK